MNLKEQINVVELPKSLDILNDGTKNRDLLYLFSSYIASNPDFKYNLTYLTDSIDIFFEDIESFKSKQIVFKKIITYLEKRTKKTDVIEIVFDSFFEYKIGESSKIKISKQNNSYPFYHMGKTCFTMQLIRHKPSKIEYTYNVKAFENNEEWEKALNSFIQIISK